MGAQVNGEAQNQASRSSSCKQESNFRLTGGKTTAALEKSFSCGKALEPRVTRPLCGALTSDGGSPLAGGWSISQGLSAW